MNEYTAGAMDAAGRIRPWGIETYSRWLPLNRALCRKYGGVLDNGGRRWRLEREAEVLRLLNDWLTYSQRSSEILAELDRRGAGR